MIAAGIGLCTLWALALFGPDIRKPDAPIARHEEPTLEHDELRIPWGLVACALVIFGVSHAVKGYRVRKSEETD